VRLLSNAQALSGDATPSTSAKQLRSLPVSRSRPAEAAPRYGSRRGLLMRPRRRSLPSGVSILQA